MLSGTYIDNQLVPAIMEIGAVTPFTWLPPSVNCSGTTGAWTAEATVEVKRASGDVDFSLCSADAIGITAPEFAPLIPIDFTYCPLRAIVRVRSQRYLDDDCTLLILTSGGARLVYLPMMQPLSQEQGAEFQESARLWRMKNCFNTPVPWHERIQAPVARRPAVGG